jgi:hypothetical protein
LILPAQTNTGRVDGIVQDPSGAAVPNAAVTAVNLRTGVTTPTVSNEVGMYVFPVLQPGFYNLEVESRGFRKFLVSNVELNTGATISRNITLTVGQTSDSVEVRANALSLQTSDSQISRAVTLRDIDTLPQLARTPIALSLYQPGVAVEPTDQAYSHINGTRQGSNNTMLDGIDANEITQPRLGLVLTPNNTDSVEEFRIITQGGKAEYGRNAGGQIELVTRGGTNTYHATAFDYLRNTDLNANDFFNNGAGQPRPRLIQNIFGASVGGPVIHNKIFFFGNYQGRRTKQDIIRVRTAPTPEAKAGLFRWMAPGSNTVSSFNIVQNDPRHIGIDPQVAKYLALFPAPNDQTVGDLLNTAGFRFNNPNDSFEDQFTMKGDYNASAKHHFFYRHSWQRISQIDSINSADTPFPGEPQGTQGGHRWGAVGGWDWIISPNVVSQSRFGYQSGTYIFLRPQRIADPQILFNSFTNPLWPKFAQGRNSPVKELTQNITWAKRTHIVKAGLNLRFTNQSGYDYAGVYPDVTTARTQGNIPPATIGPGGSTISSADRQRFENLYNDLLGRVDQITRTFYSDLSVFQSPGTPRVRNFIFHEYGYFLQDDWKLRRNLTLNLGLRYEFTGVPYEANKQQGTLNQVASLSPTNPLGNLQIQRGGWYRNDWNNFAPRLGLAWEPTSGGKMVVRANYGIFYDRLLGSVTSLVDGNTPGFSQANLVFPNSAPGSDVRISDNPALPAQPAAPVLFPANSRGSNIAVFDPQLRVPYLHEFSISVQREILRNTLLDVAYVGNRGSSLFTDVNLNQRKIEGDFLRSFKELQAFRTNGNAPSASNTLVRIFGSPTAAVAALGASVIDQGAVGTAADTVDRNNYTRYATAGVSDFYLRNYPQFNALLIGNNAGRSSYDSLQVSLRRQTGSVRFSFNYTFSKSLDNLSLDNAGFSSGPVDNFASSGEFVGNWRSQRWG